MNKLNQAKSDCQKTKIRDEDDRKYPNSIGPVRTVGKDDMLIGRAANPRTGLITPAAVSVSDLGQSRRVDGGTHHIQSAQWLWQDEQWISVDRNKKSHQAQEASPYAANCKDATLQTKFDSSPYLNKPLPPLFALPHPEGIVGSSRVVSSPCMSKGEQSSRPKVRRKVVGSPACTVYKAAIATTRSDVYSHMVQPSPVNPGLRTSSAPAQQHFSSFCLGNDARQDVYSSTGRKVQDRALGGRLRPPLRNGADSRPTNLHLYAGINDSPYPLPRARQEHRSHDDQLVPNTHEGHGRGIHSKFLDSGQNQHQQHPRVYEQPHPVWMRSRRPLVGPRDAKPYRNNQTVYAESGQIGAGGATGGKTPDRECCPQPSHVALQARSSEPLHTTSYTRGRFGIMHDDYPKRDMSSLPETSNYWLRVETDKMGALPANPSSSSNLATHLQQRVGLAVATLDSRHNVDPPECGSRNPDMYETPGTQEQEVEMPVDTACLDKGQHDVSTREGIYDHGMCCQECCREHDCHEGCLGHPNLAAKASSTETQSDDTAIGSDHASISSLDNSIKSLHEFNARRETKLARLKAVLMRTAKESLNSNPSDTSGIASVALKATLREAAAPQTQTILERRMAEQPRFFSNDNVPKSVLNAAKLAMSSPSSQVARDDRAKSSNGLAARGSRRKRTIEGQHKVHDAAMMTNIANAAKRVTNRRDPPFDSFNDEGQILPTDGSISFTKCSSFLSLLQASLSLPLLAQGRRRYFNQTASFLLGCCLEMMSVLFATASTLTAAIFTYYRVGALQLPQGITARDLSAECLRSCLYLMICAGTVAIITKILRMALIMLRIVVIPVKIVVWAIG